MLDELLPYYERELSFLRQMSAEFADRYPKIARRLQIEKDQCEDPHVERLIEAFAFLSARIHRKLDDEYPEITEAFMQVLYPHYTRPIPSATILELVTATDKPEITGRYRIARHHPVLSQEIQGVKCRFRTCYETDLWPVAVTQAKLEMAQGSEYLRRISPAAAVSLTLDLTAQGKLSFASLQMDKIRFFLEGEPPLMHLLYEMLFTGLLEVRVSDGTEDPSRVVHLPKEAVRPVGFAPGEELLEFDARSPAGYRLLAEYFAFPEKFMFFEISGLDAPPLLHPGSVLRLQFNFSTFADTERHARLLKMLSPANFRPNCVPAVNLFKQSANPIRVTHQRPSYPVIVDNRRLNAYEIYSIDAVHLTEKHDQDETTLAVLPFYSIHHFSEPSRNPFYWYATREQSPRRADKGTDLELALVDLEFRPHRGEAEVLSLELTCTNRDIPESIPFGGKGVNEEFTIPNHSVVHRVRLLRKPTSSLRPPTKRGLQWRLISHLSLNQLSMAAHGKEPLQEVLGLYNYTDSMAEARHVQGVLKVECHPATTLLPGREFAALVRGVEVSVTFDEDCYVGSSLYLFASVLERFYAQFCSPNSFVRFRMFTKQQEGEVASWPPRVGETPLI